DDIPHTVTFIKVKGTEEIIGGYNPLIWKSHSDGEYGKTKDSFIFSFKNKDNIKDSILSHVEDMNEALYYHNECGPTFYEDLAMVAKKGDSEAYDIISCRQRRYEKKLRDTEDKFLI